ncbi:DUF4436 family protein [Rhodococcus maanshanensis]|uniref:DUF4436 domain-containing protein n=1 Tax=Rhodococcus maanshanensis TaxID=183556 RepID=A0A1H7J8C3_9NOCA|nr:DUF4436 family protein [Rhodococcus maanshanensis]SEK70983.1 protein of unknown function [Rhodococcus maanshanensis]
MDEVPKKVNMPTKPRPSGRRRLLVPAAAAAAAAAVGAGIWLQIGERQDLDAVHVSGASEPVDRVDIEASVQRVDAAARELTLRILVTPRGALSDDGGLSPNEDLTLLTSPDIQQDLTFRADTRISTVDVPVALSGGSITDYPFDSYLTDIEFAARQGDHPVPVTATLSNRDALFHPTVEIADTTDTAAFEVSVSRSNGVLIYAIFMMAAMWALAIAVVIGTRFLTSRRLGLVWPALGWMAATLFALAAFRNTAPGAPPIGSLLDYTAFLWTEAIIAFCVITTVIAGARAEPPTNDS